MSGRRPTPKQVDLLAAVEEGKVKWCYGRQGAYTVLVDGQDKPVTAAAERLLDRGWTVGPNGSTGVTTDRLTTEGAYVLDEARRDGEFAAAPDEVRYAVSIRGTDLGHSPIAGGNNRPFRGREVWCRLCYGKAKQEAEAAGEKYPRHGAGSVRRINGCQRDDIAEAERAARDHVLAHLAGAYS